MHPNFSFNLFRQKWPYFENLPCHVLTPKSFVQFEFNLCFKIKENNTLHEVNDTNI